MSILDRIKGLFKKKSLLEKLAEECLADEFPRYDIEFRGYYARKALTEDYEGKEQLQKLLKDAKEEELTEMIAREKTEYGKVLQRCPESIEILREVIKEHETAEHPSLWHDDFRKTVPYGIMTIIELSLEKPYEKEMLTKIKDSLGSLYRREIMAPRQDTDIGGIDPSGHIGKYLRSKTARIPGIKEFMQELLEPITGWTRNIGYENIPHYIRICQERTQKKEQLKDFMNKGELAKTQLYMNLNREYDYKTLKEVLKTTELIRQTERKGTIWHNTEAIQAFYKTLSRIPEQDTIRYCARLQQQIKNNIDSLDRMVS